MSEMKRMQEDYKQLWNALKGMLKSFCNDTLESTLANEKQLYDDILSIMILMESEVNK